MEGPFNSQIHVCRDASHFERPCRSIGLHGDFFPERHELSRLHPQRVERRKSYRRRHGCVPRLVGRMTRIVGVCDHEVLLVMSPVMQATGWRIVDFWVQLHLMLTFAYSGEPHPTHCSTEFTTAGLWTSLKCRMRQGYPSLCWYRQKCGLCSLGVWLYLLLCLTWPALLTRRIKSLARVTGPR